MSRFIDADALDYALGASDEDIYFHHMLEDAPTIDAIPVEWLRKKRVTHPTTDAEILHNSVIRAVLVMWEREQEAR